MRFVRDALAQANGKGLHIVTVPAPIAPVASVARVLPREMSVVWLPPDGQHFATGGVAVKFNVKGSLADLHGAIAAMWKRVRHHAYAGCVGVIPRAFGGVPFRAGFADDLWADFGDGDFVLPRWSYRLTGFDSAFLSLAVDFERESVDENVLAAEFAALLTAIHDADEPLSETLRGSAEVFEVQPFEQWSTYIDAILSAIGSREFEKIVAARRSGIEFDGPVEDLRLITRLGAVAPTCTTFAFRRARSSFVGATPETLFHKRGKFVLTEALAGTTVASMYPGAQPGQAARLLDSGKDRHEHALVVDTITGVLQSMSEELTYSLVPEIRKLKELYHLRTPISARLKDGIDALHLIAALHPTPAVAGLPTAASAQWIVEHEQVPRGWYTGAIGWFDAAGESTFAVAIRCGVLAGARAYIYAGAGIVAGSDAEKEYAETHMKQLSLMRACGSA